MLSTYALVVACPSLEGVATVRFPELSRAARVDTVAASAAWYPSTLSAFRFVTVDVIAPSTVNGTVPLEGVKFQMPVIVSAPSMRGMMNVLEPS